MTRKWTTRAASSALVLGAALLAACSREPQKAPLPTLPQFVDRRAGSGVEFVHQNGKTEARRLPETMGGGVAVIDYDGDGRQDLYFVDSGKVPTKLEEQAPGGSRLYRNLGGWRFEDVTEKAGVRGRGYGMGAIVGDYDRDGRPDLYVTNYGSNILYHNEGDGRFRDVTQSAGADDVRWSTGAAFFDYDRDGQLDLLVQNYLVCRVEDFRPYSIGDVPAYPVPDLFDPEGLRLLRNRGDGTFEDATERAGLAAARGKGLGVVVADLDDDGDPDVYCANDTTANLLFENRGDGTFAEIGLESGAGYSAEGREMSGMGTDAADIDGDGQLDLVVTNFQNEPNSIYRNDGHLSFTEISSRTGTARASLGRLGFGVRWLDFDCDGLQDLVVANGHIHDNAPIVDPPATFAQPPLLFRGLGGARFEDVTARQSPSFQVPRVGRGLAVADLDDDGDPDCVFGVLGGPPALFENQGGERNAWLRVHVKGTRRDSTAIGTRVTVEAGGRSWSQEIKSGGSYLSQGDLRLLFGLGDATRVDVLRVRWPDGRVTERRELAVRAQVDVVEDP